VSDLVDETAAAVLRLTVTARVPVGENPSDVLRRAADKLDQWAPLDDDGRAVLLDLNGNRIGFVIVVEEER